MNNNTGGPAFPQVDLKDSHGMLVPDRQAGMTLRDYFAAKCMQGLSALPSDFDNDRGTLEMVAKISYEQADAMLKARGESK